MPNWCENIIEITPSNEGVKVADILTDITAKLAKRGVVIVADPTEFAQWSKEYDALDDEQRLHFSDFIPTPSIISNYDTTNIQSHYKYSENGRRGSDSSLIKENFNNNEEFFKFTDEQKVAIGNVLAEPIKNLPPLSKLTLYHNIVNVELSEEQRDQFWLKWEEIEKQQQEEFGVVGWYDWNCKYYGCKWNCSFHIVEISENYLILSVDTPWSPAEPVFNELQELYSAFNFYIKCKEEGMGFALFYETSRFDEEDNVYLECNDAVYGVTTDDKFFMPYQWEDELADDDDELEENEEEL